MNKYTIIKEDPGTLCYVGNRTEHRKQTANSWSECSKAEPEYPVHIREKHKRDQGEMENFLDSINTQTYIINNKQYT